VITPAALSLAGPKALRFGMQCANILVGAHVLASGGSKLLWDFRKIQI
jgi:hypothetical protein